MLNPKNNLLRFNYLVNSKNVFLKLCYFFSFLLLFSCGSDTAKKESKTDDSKVKAISESSKNSSSKKIIFFGDSLSAGYGLDDVNDAFPGIIQTKIDSLGLDYTVVNSGVSGETTAGGKNRIDWVLNEKFDVFVLELGANDGLRGIPLSETRKNLQIIIDAVLKKNATTKIILAGMQLPPNMGIDYTSSFKSIFPDLAKKNDVYLVPFLLENVGGVSKLNQADGIHPTAEGHKILAENVWTVLKPIIL
jgi:acyl-CoA thioesterase-1